MPQGPRPRPALREAAFTLIELMIVVAIIGVLAAISIPKFAELIRKSNEGYTKGNLGQLRSALAIYYGDMEGVYPSDLYAMTVSAKYLSSVPPAKVSDYHPVTYAERIGFAGTEDDAGGWQYNRTYGAANYGEVWVNCTHTDTKGSWWTYY